MSGTNARLAALPAAGPYPPSPDLRSRRAAGPKPTRKRTSATAPRPAKVRRYRFDPSDAFASAARTASPSTLTSEPAGGSMDTSTPSGGGTSPGESTRSRISSTSSFCSSKGMTLIPNERSAVLPVAPVSGIGLDDRLREVRREEREDALDPLAVGQLVAEQVGQGDRRADARSLGAAIVLVPAGVEHALAIVLHPCDDLRVGQVVGRDRDVDLPRDAGLLLERAHVLQLGKARRQKLVEVGDDLRSRPGHPAREREDSRGGNDLPRHGDRGGEGPRPDLRHAGAEARHPPGRGELAA